MEHLINFQEFLNESKADNPKSLKGSDLYKKIVRDAESEKLYAKLSSRGTDDIWSPDPNNENPEEYYFNTSFQPGGHLSFPINFSEIPNGFKFVVSFDTSPMEGSNDVILELQEDYTVTVINWKVTKVEGESKLGEWEEYAEEVLSGTEEESTPGSIGKMKKKIRTYQEKVHSEVEKASSEFVKRLKKMYS